MKNEAVISSKELVQMFAKAFVMISVDDDFDDDAKREHLSGLLDIVKKEEHLTEEEKKNFLSAIKQEVLSMPDDDIAVVDWLLNTAEGEAFAKEHINKEK